MFLKYIDITQFRGICQLKIQLDHTTVLIGENNTGKSTILDAIQLALGSFTTIREKAKFVEYDHHLATKDSQASDSSPIEIILHFSEEKLDEWAAGVTQKLSEVIQIDAEYRQSVTLRVRCKYDADIGESVPKWDFLDLKKQELKVNASQYKKWLQSLVPVFSLKSIRNPDQEFRSSSMFWKPFVRSMTMDSSSRHDLEEELTNLNQRIIDAHGSFDVVEEHLNDIAKLVPLMGSNPVNIEALPSRVLDILSRTQVSLASITGAGIPIRRHGEGTQSLSIICLFIAFLRSKLGDQYSELVSPILTLEEPEAHLHPSAAYSVTKLLDNPCGQNIIATHSGDLIANVPVHSLRCLRRKDDKIVIYQVDWDTFNTKEKTAIDHHIRTTRGNIFFAHCWLLIEGETERLVFDACASIYEIDLIHEGIYCIEYVHTGNLKALINLAKQLGIEWFIVADGDDAGNSYIKKAKKVCDENKEDHICQLDHILDVVFCLEGYGHHYERFDSTRSAVQTHNKDASYWKNVVKANDEFKIFNAVSVINEIRKNGKDGVPEAIHQIIHKVTQLARGE